MYLPPRETIELEEFLKPHCSREQVTEYFERTADPIDTIVDGLRTTRDRFLDLPDVVPRDSDPALLETLLQLKVACDQICRATSELLLYRGQARDQLRAYHFEDIATAGIEEILDRDGVTDPAERAETIAYVINGVRARLLAVQPDLQLVK